ncbi:MAG: hypothetical protein LBH27_02875, partial [Endomicrobium sp.]|nr:hypothetical protein [Endomicrobium sp.]
GFIFSIITIEQKIVVNNNFIRIIGLFFIIAIILYILFSIFCSRPIKLFKWTIRFPNIKTVLFQILLSTCDWFIASFILYIFISPSKVPYCFFLEVFLISQLAGIVCQTPGGLMALEISITSLLKNYLSSSTIMSGLLLYRIVLYFFPLLIASILFVLLEIFVSTKKKLRIYY